IVAVDPDLRITRFNPWAEKITGRSEQEAIGCFCGDVLKGGRCNTDCPLRTVISRRQPSICIETTVRNSNGETITVEMSTAGLFDQDGKLLGAVEAFLDISKKKAQEREKANLISMFAHDMNSSLTGIHGLGLRLLKTDDLNQEGPRKFIEIITKEAGKLEFLVKDFLEFSRLQTGRLNLTFDATFLDKELYELFNTYEPKAAAIGIKLTFESAASLPVIEADANRLRRVFANLLDNALKFSPKSTTVAISIEESEKEVMVKVKDEGRGIDPKDLPYIYDIFHKGTGAGKKEGYGVGLAIVKTIIEGHGGRVMVTSELGKGSVFTVFLPKIRKLGEE
ncbi:MAG: PAS domain-containing sensor histidine kinase, partial [Desulforhabdus sp.]|nr:PAS domain-containing sensor histidine kinase [Desulforhabdus sp.]